MAYLTTSVEYGIHCLLWLAASGDTPLSSRELAELQGISPSFLAKIFPKLEKAGIVAASEGIRGGYRLARTPDQITVLEIVDAVEGAKPIFDCQEIRGRCAVFGEKPPHWATAGVCEVHAVMLRAEKAMRASLASETLGGIATTFGRKVPAEFGRDVEAWIAERSRTRTGAKRRAPDEDPPP